MVSKVENFGYWALLGMLVWPILTVLGPSVEGRLFPVVVSTELTRVTSASPTSSLVYGSSRKVRECTYVDTEWYYGDPQGKSVRIPLEVLEPSKIRNEGNFSFGPWSLKLDKELVLTESYAIVTHNCHWLWRTETIFWP